MKKIYNKNKTLVRCFAVGLFCLTFAASNVQAWTYNIDFSLYSVGTHSITTPAYEAGSTITVTGSSGYHWTLADGNVYTDGRTSITVTQSGAYGVSGTGSISFV
ncbi:MAG: hypothetical protein LBR18_05620, partial [Tannerella sp.]|nr:hypothetical protein [Tannerella sp.]